MVSFVQYCVKLKERELEVYVEKQVRKI
jgi:hypothetical protein